MWVLIVFSFSLSLLFVFVQVLHDQLHVRMSLWDSMLAEEAAAGSHSARIMLDATLETLKTHQIPTPTTTTTKIENMNTTN